MVFCTNCGKTISVTAKFCANCGKQTAVTTRGTQDNTRDYSRDTRDNPRYKRDDTRDYSRDTRDNPRYKRDDTRDSGDNTRDDDDYFLNLGTFSTGAAPTDLFKGKSTKPSMALARKHSDALGTLFNYRPTAKSAASSSGRASASVSKPGHLKPKSPLSKTGPILRMLLKVVVLPVTAMRSQPGAPFTFVEFVSDCDPIDQINQEITSCREIRHNVTLLPKASWKIARRVGKGEACHLERCGIEKLSGFDTFRQFLKDKREVYCLAAAEPEPEPDDDANEELLESPPNDLTYHGSPRRGAQTSTPKHVDDSGKEASTDDDEKDTTPTYEFRPRKHRPGESLPEMRRQRESSESKDTEKTPEKAAAGKSSQARSDAATSADTTPVEDLLRSMEKFVGLKDLKVYLEDFAKSIFMQRLVKNEVDTGGMHMVFSGNPGTGKTTVATALTGFLYKIGIVSKEQPVVVQRGDLTSKWVGHTSEKTRKKVQASKGGVMLVDEAYRLAQADSSSKDVGKEALEEIMSFMEGGDPIMIFAGYPAEMASLLDVNPGLKSRIAYNFDFPDFNVKELADIMRMEVENKGLRLTSQANQDLATTVENSSTEPQRSKMNGRLARQVVKEAERHMYARCYPNDIQGCGLITQEDLEYSFQRFLSGRP
ncbi:uncharacterized protein LOC144863227 [Branchiostoma floridae x Branchiostoma japonicum]